MLYKRCAQRGFTLVELIMVIVLMGVIGGMVAVFMVNPIEAYLDGNRRAALTDVADTVVRRMARDIQRALPNSPHASDDQKCIEFIPTKTGGRYRADGTVDALQFGTPIISFNMLGANSSLADQRIVVGDLIAVSNMGMQDEQNAFFNSNTAAISTVEDVAATPTPLNGPQTKLGFLSKTFGQELKSDGEHFRFQVIPKDEQVVAYVCSGSNLYRLARKTLATATLSSPANICPATGLPTIESTDPIIASYVNCADTNFEYDDISSNPNPNNVGPRNALARMRISVTDAGETVSLYHEVHVSSEP